MDTDGNCLGTITQAGGTAEFIGTDGVSFLKGDETFWRSNSDPAKADAVVKLVADKWVNMGTDERWILGALRPRQLYRRPSRRRP